jgi:predicted RNA-binding Zn-ribbon protein involved in translation (DUF1610 family)
VHYEESPEDLTADRAVFSSADGRRLTQVAYNIGPKKRRIEPSDLADPYGDWDPLPEGDEGWVGGEYDELGDDEEIDSATGAKRKRYQSSVSLVLFSKPRRTAEAHRLQDDPNTLWRQLQQTFLDEMVHCDGLGDALGNPSCSSCGAKTTSDATVRLFRCSECGPYLQCHACILACHSMQPLHILKVQCYS